MNYMVGFQKGRLVRGLLRIWISEDANENEAEIRNDQRSAGTFTGCVYFILIAAH